VVLPILQPRKDPLNGEQLGVYLRLVRQAYCQGDWVDALVEIVDLSGDGDVVAVPLDEASIVPASDAIIRRYVKTFVEAKRIADAKRAERPKKTVKLPLDELFGTKE
jgi:hypothetical protein